MGRLAASGLAAALILASVAQPRGGAEPNAPFSDTRLYRAIDARVERGQDYYAAAAAEQRAHGYPTWPPVVIREPTEAFFLNVLGSDATRWAALLALAGVTMEATRRALARTDLSPRERLWTLAFATSGMAGACSPPVAYLHEIWASLLMALCLALRRPNRWAASVCAGVVACLFRETALPLLAVMAAFALYERRYREAASWIGAGALFLVLFAFHLLLASRQHLPTDLVSGGWMQIGGLPFIIATARANALLVLAPPVVIATALSASLLGFLGRRDAWLARCGATFALYLGLFSVIGRPDNDYWGLLYAPLLPLGVALAPAAIRDLAVRALGLSAPAAARHDPEPAPTAVAQARR